MCIGGPEATIFQSKAITILVHWTLSSVKAEGKAQEVYDLFYASNNFEIDGVKVSMIDPGAGPIPAGKDEKGICEYVINAQITYKRS